MPFDTPAEYNDHLIQNLTNISLEEYFSEYHKQFYPDQDISFMEYFLELCKYKHDYYVPHTKLFEYGIMSDGSSSDVRKRLDKLKLKNDIHYRLGKVSEPVKQGGIVTTHIYMLKPKAFKKILMRAGKNSKQTIDVEIYADYYLLLEDVQADYVEYERSYAKRIDSFKDKKIDRLIELTQNQSKQLDIQSKQLDIQSNDMSTLMKYAETTNEKLEVITIELKEVRAQLAKLTAAVVSLAYIPNIYKRFYDRDHAGKKVRDGKRFSLTSVGKTKTLVFVATYIPTQKQLKIECVNRKLSEPLIQVDKIIERAEYFNGILINKLCEEMNIGPIDTDAIREELENKFQRVLMPQSYGISSINEQEVRSTFSRLNKKSSQFKQAVYEYGVSDITWNTKFKAMLINNVDSLEVAKYCFNKFIEANQIYNIHSYDQSLEKSINDSGEVIAPESLTELKRCNNEFANNSKLVIDTFYRKIYVCDTRDTTYLRLRNNPKITLPELKNKVRELVIEGLDFD